MSSSVKKKKNIFIKKKRKVWNKKNVPFWLKRKACQIVIRVPFCNQDEWLEEYLSMGLYNTVNTKSEESETEYDQSDLSSDGECSFTEADDDPDENGKKQKEILPMEEGAYAAVFINAMQKVEDERTSCIHCSGETFSVIEDNDSSQSLGQVWNFECPNSMHKSAREIYDS